MAGGTPVGNQGYAGWEVRAADARGAPWDHRNGERVCRIRCYIGTLTISYPSHTHTQLQARFGLSSAQHWSQTDGAFSYKKFYNRILLQLEDDDDEHTQDIMAFYNK